MRRRINVSTRFAGRVVAARMCRVGRVSGKVDSLWLRALNGVLAVPSSCAGWCHLWRGVMISAVRR